MKILDKNISDSNFAKFRSCIIKNFGKKIEFRYVNGVTYEVELNYLLKWFYGPHFIKQNGKWKKINNLKFKNIHNKNIFIKKCRHTRNHSCIRVYMNNDMAIDVVWDTVLMACEPDYEHFGGLTEESKKRTHSYFKKKMKKLKKLE